MDKTEKIIIYASVLVLAIFFFGVLIASKLMDADVPECVPNGKPFSESKIEKIDHNTYQVFYVASMWRFEPKVLKIPKGTEVDLYLSTKDVVHGLHIENTNVNIMAVPGSINKLTHTFNKKGIYNVTCHEYCGSGHQSMSAQIIVQ